MSKCKHYVDMLGYCKNACEDKDNWSLSHCLCPYDGNPMKCEDWKESDLTISLAKLREVLNEELESAMLNNSLRADNVADFTDKIINRIKQELK